MKIVKKPKLIISDIDGTIFDRKDTVTEGLRRLKTILAEHRIPFTLASGRCYADMKSLIEFLDVSLPVIVNNGAGIMTESQMYWGAQINPEDIREAVRYADTCGMMVSLYEAEKEKVYRHNAYVQSYIDRFGKKYQYCVTSEKEMDEQQWKDMRIQKLLIIDPQKPGRIETVINKIREASDHLSVVQYDDRSIDVMPKSCSKENGVAKLAGMLGIAMEDIMAVGDNENDIEMLRHAGIGVAVNNATDTLKAAADYISAEEAAAGVAKAVEKFYVLLDDDEGEN
ncbi:Cof-type HAD-IIB family hydrolase [Clostridium sp. MCC353]|uniref:Cof-type HAD-IIB family hydrolase n=1 Tax=Clostridium sp. MCC353 TaxID=2592646 RepID=UPI001C01B348|nr:Cof-type HAD-IIB family hydrolase [Clostridium sp. MCC353]